MKSIMGRSMMFLVPLVSVLSIHCAGKESQCTSNDNCPGGYICVDSQCAKRCIDSDCLGGYICSSETGLCTPGDADASGMFPEKNTTESNSTTESNLKCIDDQDCSQGQYCTENKVCLRYCQDHNDTHCPKDYLCISKGSKCVKRCVDSECPSGHWCFTSTGPCVDQGDADAGTTD